MKASCKALKLSIFISGISLSLVVIFIYLVFEYECQIYEILLNIFISLFGSSFVALLLAIPAYIVNKRQLLEKYWQEVYRLIVSISNIDYLFNKYSDDAVVGYIRELTKPLWQIEYEKSKRIDGSINKKKYMDILIKEYYDNILNLHEDMPEEELKKYFEEDVDRYIERIRKKAKKIFDEYIIVSNESTIKLNFMLGDMEFITGKKEYTKIHTTTYQPLHDILMAIEDVSCCFKTFLDGTGDEAVSIEELLEMQKKIFNLEIIDTEVDKRYVIHNKFIEDMLKKLEAFKANMYNSKPDENQTSYPPEYIIYSKKN